MNTRTRIVELTNNRCTVTRFDEMEDRMVTTEYMAPRDGGYVRIDDGRQYPQVCSGLCSAGETLEWFPRIHPTLAGLIRREYQRARRADRREEVR